MTRVTYSMKVALLLATLPRATAAPVGRGGASANECNPSRGCTVCDSCCSEYITLPVLCDKCVADHCHRGSLRDSEYEEREYASSLGFCSDQNPACSGWAKQGECQGPNAAWLAVSSCRFRAGHCSLLEAVRSRKKELTFLGALPIVVRKL